MTKILKKVQLSTEQSTPKSADPTKGTAENPYSQVEMATLQEEGTWNGGYVEGMGLVPMMTEGMDVSSGDSLNGIIDLIKTRLHLSSFEVKCLWHYLTNNNNDNLLLTNNEWNMVKNAIPENFDYQSGKSFTYQKKEYYITSVNYYGNQDLDWALGCADVTFTTTGTPVGIKDPYNFDALVNSHRTELDEYVTRLIGCLGIGKPYNIVYGIHE